MRFPRVVPKQYPTPAPIPERWSGLKALGTGFASILVHSSTSRYAIKDDLVTGVESQQYGGRWNPVGLAAVYASLTPETAMAETRAHHRHDKLSLEQAMPRTFVAMEVQLAVDIGSGRRACL